MPRDLRRRLVWSLVASLVAGAALTALGSLRHPLWISLVIVLLAGVAVALVPWLLEATGRRAEPALWSAPAREESVAPAALDYRLLRLRRDLRDALERDDRPDTIHAVVRDLTAERLAEHHDVDLATQPEPARALMTPGLWSYLSAPPTGTRRSSRSALHTAIEGIEKL